MHPRYGVRRYRNNEVGVRIIATDKEYSMCAESETKLSMQSYSIIMTHKTMHRNSWLHVGSLKLCSERINFGVHDNGRKKRI